MTLNHRRDWSLDKEQTVSMGTFGGGIRSDTKDGTGIWSGWRGPREHGITLGGALLWQDPASRAW